MTNCSFVFVYLMIIATLVTLVSVEMDLIILIFDVLEAERFVPSLREHIKRYLTTDTELQIQILKLILESCHECLPDLVLFVVFFEGVSFILRAIPTNWRDVHHAIPVLKESSPKN